MSRKKKQHDQSQKQFPCAPLICGWCGKPLQPGEESNNIHEVDTAYEHESHDNSGKEKPIISLNLGQKRIRHAMVNALRPLYPELLKRYVLTYHKRKEVRIVDEHV